MKTIWTGNIGNEEKARAFADKVSGQSFYNFNAIVTPAQGNWTVDVSAKCGDGEEAEAVAMLVFILAEECK
jgi:hypothetical protein